MVAVAALRGPFSELGLYDPAEPVMFKPNGMIMTPDEVAAELERAPANPNPFDASNQSAEAQRMRNSGYGAETTALVDGARRGRERDEHLKTVRARQIMTGSAFADLINDIDTEIARIDVELAEAGEELAGIQAAMAANRAEREPLAARLAEERIAHEDARLRHAELEREQGLETEELDLEERELAERLARADAAVNGARSADEAIVALREREEIETRMAEIEARRLELAETLRGSEMTVSLYEESIERLEGAIAELDRQHAELEGQEAATQERITALEQQRADLVAAKETIVELQNSGEPVTIGQLEAELPESLRDGADSFILQKTQDPSWLERHFGADSAIFETAEGIYNSTAEVVGTVTDTVSDGVTAVTEFASDSWATISGAWTNFYANAEPTGDGIEGTENVALAYNNATDPAVSGPDSGPTIPTPQGPIVAQQFTT